MQKITFSILAISFFFVSCDNKTEAPKKNARLYSAEQLYNNKSIGGVAYNTDESRILVHANMSGIYNLYELNISDTLLNPLTHSTKESFFAIDYLPASDKYLYSADK